MAKRLDFALPARRLGPWYLRPDVPDFPSLKARQMLRVLMGPVLQYYVERQNGSHRKLVSRAGYPPLFFSSHDGQTLSPGLVRKILIDDVGLSEDTAREVL